MPVAEQMEQPVAKEQLDLFAREGAIFIAQTKSRFERDYDIPQYPAFRSVLFKRQDVCRPHLASIRSIQAADKLVIT